VTFNGQLYGIPYAIENVVLFRNTDLAPQAPKTLDELVAKGKELKAAGKVNEIMALPVGPNGDAYHMYPIYTSAGGYLFGKGAEGDYDPKDLGLSKPEAAKAFEKISKLGEKGDGASSAPSAPTT
jgi:arabinogalactan oligomer / maltooligosaccharide transport system substrate-binding protein